MRNDRIMNYHATWLAAARKGTISMQTAMMLIDAFELGIAECNEHSIDGDVSGFASMATNQTADIRQLFRNHGETIAYSPTCLQVEQADFNQAVSEIDATYSFRFRAIVRQIDN